MILHIKNKIFISKYFYNQIFIHVYQLLNVKFRKGRRPSKRELCKQNKKENSGGVCVCVKKERVNLQYQYLHNFKRKKNCGSRGEVGKGINEKKMKKIKIRNLSCI